MATRGEKPMVAIVGRPNVGKSTLFNRIVGRRGAIVHSEEGTTRDRMCQDSTWNGVEFTLVDTGGLLKGVPEGERSSKSIMEQIKDQALLAVKEASVVLFLVDLRDGITPGDLEVAELLRQRGIVANGKKLFVVANKGDNSKLELDAAEFFQLGFGPPRAISALNGRRIGELLDDVVDALPEVEAVEEETSELKLAIVGRPNVGKSTLINSLINQQRMIVDKKPGTTRDSVDIAFRVGEQDYLLIDTAGLPRRKNIRKAVEKYSAGRSFKSIERSDISLLMLDATEGLVDQDSRIANYIVRCGKGMLIVANKWDLVEKDHRTHDQLVQMIRSRIPTIDFAPIITLSALTKQRTERVLPAVDAVFQQYDRRVPTATFNSFLQSVYATHPPASRSGQRLKISYGTQVSTRPPTFVLFVNNPALLYEGYTRYIRNRIRDAFGFEGVPLIIQARRKADGARRHPAPPGRR